MPNGFNLNNNRIYWHQLSISDILKILAIPSSEGLSQQQCNSRLQQYGKNQLQEKSPVRWYQVFLRQFKNLLIVILLIAAVISLFLNELTNAITISAIVFLNGVLGAIQEYKAETAIQSLKKMLSHQCKVIRDGQLRIIDTKLLVPGDLVLLETGCRVPADLKLTRAINLQCDEAALTGESQPTHKNTKILAHETPIPKQHNMAWMGTDVVNGEGQGIVVATGMNTEFGRIAKLTANISEKLTNLQKKLSELAKNLAVLAIVLSFMIAFIGIVAGQSIPQMFMQGISLAVAAIPEGLPAVVTITLALGVRMMIRHKALLRHLQAAETLGATNIICTDKTGTLTKNEMTITTIWTLSGQYELSGVGYSTQGKIFHHHHAIDASSHTTLRYLLETGTICNHAHWVEDDTNPKIIGTPTESALWVAARKAGLPPRIQNLPIHEFSFNSQRKRMSVVEEVDHHYVVHIKGAAEELLTRSTHIYQEGYIIPLTESLTEEIHQAFNELAKQGLRTLALARKEFPKTTPLTEESVESELVFLGIVGIMDPPREHVKDSILLAQKAGIKIIMMTGDAPGTALSIAKQIGLNAPYAITGEALSRLSDDDLQRALSEGALFARTIPEHKIRIVKLLQANRHIVAMTGDGINDAPALKQADVGIAMGIRGTDVAKSVADMVLADDNFTSIVQAIEEGRRQYANIQKFVRYLLSSNMGEILAIFINIILGGPLILLPVQILWMNLVTDGLTAVTLGLEKPESDLMIQPPRRMDESILNAHGLFMILILGVYISVTTLWIFYFFLDNTQANTAQIALANTIAFTTIVMLEKINIFNFRSLHAPLFTISFFSNPWLLIAIAFTIGLQALAVYHPHLQTALGTTALHWQHWLLIVAISLPIFCLTELAKYIRYKIKGNSR